MLKGLDKNQIEIQLEGTAEAPNDIEEISDTEISTSEAQGDLDESIELNKHHAAVEPAYSSNDEIHEITTAGISINDEQSSLDEPRNLSEGHTKNEQEEATKANIRNKSDKKSRLDALLLRKQKLESSLKEIEEKRKKVEKSISVTAKTASRKKMTRFKTHAGGIIKMVGLLDYEYDAPYEDNPQDRLAANLIAGVLLESAKKLSNASIKELHAYFDAGSKYRTEAIKSRPVPPRNKLFEEFCKELISESKIKIHKPKEKDSTND